MAGFGSPRMVGIAMCAVAAILWGTTGTSATFVTDVGPLAVGAASLGIGGLLQAAVAFSDIRGAKPQLRRHRQIVFIGALSVAVHPLAFYASVHYAGVAIGTVISIASAPVCSGIIERVVDGKRLSQTWCVAALLGCVGSAVLAASQPSDSRASAGSLMWGIVLGVVSGLTFAVYSWAGHRLMTAGITRGAAMGSVFGGGGLMLMPVLALTGGPLLAHGVNLAVAAYNAVVPMFLGYIFYGLGLTTVRASTATTVALIEPVVATVLAVVVVGERLSGLGWAAMVLIGAVVLFLTREEEQSPASGASASS